MSLSKFLLAWSDRNWFWIFARLRPAKDRNWSLFLTLGLAVLGGAISALWGLGLAMIWLRQPVGWLPWLTGLMGFCAGLCWFGVAGLCWNQRAARLRADPSVSTDLPKARYPFFRWCLGLLYVAMLGLVTPFALVVTVENIRGEVAWKHEYAQLHAKGERLRFSEILGPAIPAAQNAGAAAIFAPLFEYHREAPQRVLNDAGEAFLTSGVVWDESNQVHQLEMTFRTPAAYPPDDASGSRNHPKTPWVDVSDWSAAYRSALEKPKAEDRDWTKSLNLPEPGNAARDVLAGLSRADSDLALICAAAALPRSQFPLHYEDTFDTLLRHLSLMKGIQQTLQLRCAAHLALGDTQAAFADATNSLNVAELLREEPLLISQLVRYAQVTLAINTLWQGLAQHRWSDAQLQFLQERLSQIDCLPGIVLAFEGERACGIAGIDRMVDSPQAYDNMMGPPAGVLRLLRLIPRSVLRQNQVWMAEYQSEALANMRAIVAAAPRDGLAASIQSNQTQVDESISGPYSPYSALFKLLAPATARSVEKTARAQTTVQMAIVACALERYRIAHGEFPQMLDQLMPQFLPAVPPDPMVNQPFHYARTDDGWYALYSVGLNGRDDGGVMESGDKTDKEPKDWPWPVPTRPTHPRLF